MFEGLKKERMQDNEQWKSCQKKKNQGQKCKKSIVNQERSKAKQYIMAIQN